MEIGVEIVACAILKNDEATAHGLAVDAEGEACDRLICGAVVEHSGRYVGKTCFGDEYITQLLKHGGVHQGSERYIHIASVGILVEFAPCP